MSKVRVNWSHAGHAQVTVYDCDEFDVAPAADAKPVLLIRKDQKLIATVNTWHEVSYVDDSEACGTREGVPVARPVMPPTYKAA